MAGWTFNPKWGLDSFTDNYSVVTTRSLIFCAVMVPFIPSLLNSKPSLSPFIQHHMLQVMLWNFLLLLSLSLQGQGFFPLMDGKLSSFRS